jgi:hypothetical protein
MFNIRVIIYPEIDGWIISCDGELDLQITRKSPEFDKMLGLSPGIHLKTSPD